MELSQNIISKTIFQFHLDDFILEKHYEHIELVELKKDTIILHQDEYADYFYIFLEGKIRIYQISSNGKMIILYTTEQPEILGELELISKHPILSYVDLVKDSKLIRIPITYCRNVMLKDIHFLSRISFNLAQSLYRIERNSVINLSLNLEDRVSSYILSIEQNGYFEINLKELSDILGTTYRHLLRILKKFKEMNIISSNGNVYHIEDKEKLSNHNLDNFIL